MTIIGTRVEHDRALLWADSEGYLRDRHTDRIVRSTGHQMKLAVNERTRVAVAGAGDVGGNGCIAEAVAGAHSFDHICLELPSYMRVEARDRVDAGLPWPDWVCIVAGYSDRRQRVMAAVFAAPLNFNPTYVAVSYTLPQVAEPDLLFIAEPLDVLPIAQKQAQVVRRKIGMAVAGTLTVADVRRHGSAVSAFDLSGGYGLSKVPDHLKPMSALPEISSVRELAAPLSANADPQQCGAPG